LNDFHRNRNWLHQIIWKKFDFFWLDFLHYFFDNLIIFWLQNTNFRFEFFEFLTLNDFKVDVSLFQNVRSDLTWAFSMRQNFSSIHRKMNLSQFELFRFVSNYLINSNHFAWFHSSCRFLKTNINATLRWLFDEANIISSSNSDESSLLFWKRLKLWARNVRQIKYSELWICDNVKLLYKDKYVDMRRLIVEKISFTNRFFKYSSKAFESLIFLQVERKTS
jgi:hypothetical protein